MPPNKLNNLDPKTWLKFQKSWFVHNPPPRKKGVLVHPAKFPETMAQEFIESGLPTQVAPYSTFNASGYHAYASSRSAAVRHERGQVSHFVAYPDASVYTQQQSQNDIIDR